MLDSLLKLIREQDLIPPGSSVLCAVSGGADSVCLLHALYHLRPKLGFSLAAAHYNHHLRGEESEGDALFVEQLVSLCFGKGQHSNQQQKCRERVVSRFRQGSVGGRAGSSD